MASAAHSLVSLRRIIFLSWAANGALFLELEGDSAPNCFSIAFLLKQPNVSVDFVLSVERGESQMADGIGHAYFLFPNMMVFYLFY